MINAVNALKIARLSVVNSRRGIVPGSRVPDVVMSVSYSRDVRSETSVTHMNDE
jgi:hypothetical protein